MTIRSLSLPLGQVRCHRWNKWRRVILISNLCEWWITVFEYMPIYWVFLIFTPFLPLYCVVQFLSRCSFHSTLRGSAEWGKGWYSFWHTSVQCLLWDLQLQEACALILHPGRISSALGVTNERRKTTVLNFPSRLIQQKNDEHEGQTEGYFTSLE